MKKLILIFTLISAIVLGQQENTYKLKMNLDKDLSVHILELKKKDYEVQIAVPSLDSYTQEIRIVLTGKKRVDEFVKILTDLKIKYLEWSENADKNNVSNFIKAMPINNGIFYTKFVFINSYDKNFNSVNSSPIELAFLRRDGNNYLLLRNAIELKDYYNYKTAKVFLSAFSDVQEIDNLLSILSNENIDKTLISKNKIDEIFK